MPCSHSVTYAALLLLQLVKFRCVGSETISDASAKSSTDQFALKAHQHEFKGAVVHVFIINLRKRRERLSRTVDLLSRQELPNGWELNIHRVDPHTLRHADHGQHTYPHWVMSKADVEKLPPSPGSSINEMKFYWSSPITKGEVACFMSHMKVARLVLDVPPELPTEPPAPGMPDGPRPEQLFLVLEDDIEIEDPRGEGKRNMFNMIKKIYDEVVAHDPEWHYVSLGRAALDERSKPLSAESKYVSRPGFFYQTQAQLLSRAGAKKFLSRNTSHNIIAYDEWLNAAGRFHPRPDLNALYFEETDPLHVYASTNPHFIKQYEAPTMDHDTIPGLLPEKQGTDALGPDAVQSFVESVRTLLFDVGEDAEAKRHSAAAHLGAHNTSALTSLSLHRLCSSIFVFGAGSHEYNGRYEIEDFTTLDFVQKSDGDEQKLGPGLHRELFLAADPESSTSINVWWNFQQKRGPPVQTEETWDNPAYGAWAVPAGLPPTVGWSSKLSMSNWPGLAPMPVVLSPAALFGAQCASTPIQGLKGFARSQSDLVSGRAQISDDVPSRVHFFTINAAAHRTELSVDSVKQHLSAAHLLGQTVQVFLGPWQGRIMGKIKHAMWRTISAARPKDILVFGNGFDMAWLCPSRRIEKILRRSGRPILLSAGYSWACPGCDAILRSQYETKFKADDAGGNAPKPQYVDGAAWVGEAWALRLFAEAIGKQGWMTRNGGTSDRAAWIEWAVENENMVAVDHAQELTMTIAGGSSSRCRLLHAKEQLVNSCTSKPTCGVRVLSNSDDDVHRELESVLSTLETFTLTRHNRSHDEL